MSDEAPAIERLGFKDINARMNVFEVVQLYVKDLNSSVKQPIKELRSFDRMKLGKGESIRVSFKLTNQDFLYWITEKNGWNIEPGKFEIMIGASSEDIRLKGIVRISD